MAFILKDRVKESTTTTGTGNISLGGALATFDTFQTYLSNGDTTFYAIAHTSSGVDEWEVGLGTWNTGNTLSRTTVLAGSNGTSAVTFSAGTKDIFMTYPASKAIVSGEDAAFANITVTGTVDGRDVAADGSKLDGVEASADVTDTANVTSAGALMRSGGTMTGNLVLNANPSAALGAATKQYVDTEVSSLVDSAPSTLDTLNELAAALGDDANFSTTVTNSIATKLPLSGGTMSGQLVIADNDGGQPMLQVRNHSTTNTGAFTDSYTAEIRGSTSGSQTHGMLINLKEANDSRRTLDIGDLNGVFASFVNGKLGLGRTAPSHPLHIADAGGNTILELQRTNSNGTGTFGAISFTASDDHSVAAIHASGDGDNEGAHLIFRTTSAASQNNYFNSTSERMRITSDGDITVKGGRIFVNESDNGNTAVGITRDADEGYVQVYSAGSITTSIRGNGDSYFNGGNVGIGTSSPAGTLHLHSADTALRLTSSDGSNTPLAQLQYSGSGGYFLRMGDSSNNEDVMIRTYGNSHFNGGNVGIGTTNPIADLSIVDSSTGSGIEIQPEVTTNTNRITNYDRAESAYKKFRLDASEQQFYISGSQKMTLDTSGNLLVGKTSSSTSSVGAEFNSDGTIVGVRSGGHPLLLNRTTSDGAIAQFRKDGTTVGSIGTIGGDTITIGSGDTGLLMNQTNNEIIPWNTSTNAANSGAIDLGDASHKFKDLYLSGAVNAATGAYTGNTSINGTLTVGTSSTRNPIRIFSNNWPEVQLFKGTTEELRIGAADSSGVYNTSQGDFYVYDPTGNSMRLIVPIGASGSITRNNGAITVWDSGNDGSGSGLDADLLDGVHASGFVRGDGTNQSAVDIRADNTDFIVRDTGDSITNFIWRDHSANTLYLGTANAVITARSTINANSNNITNVNQLNGGTPWTSANDGSGSGLDADTVDGKQATDLLHYRGIVSGDWDNIFTTGTGKTNTSGLYQINNHQSGHSNYPSGSYSYGGVFAWQLANSTFKLYAPHTGTLWYQTGWSNDEYSGWRKIWDSGNDGSGSGLDADLLDGVHGSAFARKDSGVPDFQYGIQAGELYLGTDGDTDGDYNLTLKATGNNTLYLNHGGTGHVDSLNAIYAPQFYDRDNSAYYVDPNSDSRMARLNIGDTSNYIIIGDESAGFNTSYAQIRTTNTGALRIDSKQGQDLYLNWYNTSATHVISESPFRSPVYYDRNDTAYYTNPANNSVMNQISLGTAGNGSNTKGRFISLEGNTDSSGEGSGRIFFSEHNGSTSGMDAYGMSIGYRGGATSITGVSGNSWTGLAQIGNGAWGMWGHDANATGALIMYGDRAATYVNFAANDIQNVGTLTATTIRPGDGNDGYFFSDNNGRTAFDGGDFYIKSGVGNCYLYATNTYLGPSSGSNIYTRGNTISGDSWSITGAGVATLLRTDIQELNVNGGTRNNTNDATVYITATNNNDWGLVVNKYNSSASEYGVDIRMGSSFSYGLRVLAAGSTRFVVDSNKAQHNTSVRAPIFYDSDNTSYYFDGSSTGDSIRVAGNIVAYYSDERLKDIEGNIDSPLEKVSQLNGFYYTANKKAQTLGYKDNRQVGVSAQQVEAVMPEVVTDAAIGHGYKTVDYAKLVPLLIEAVKEQQDQIETLKSRLEKLEN